MAFIKNINISRLYIILFSTLIALTFLPNKSTAQNEIEGVWKSEKDDYMIKVTSLGTEFQARIVWLKEEKDTNGTIKLDEKNPEEKFRKIPIKGLKVITGLVYISNNTWGNGSIYIPEEGKYYQCKAIVSGNKLTLSIIFENNSSKNWHWFKQD